MNIKLKLLNVYIRTVRMFFGLNKNKVLFLSFSGRSYSDNPRAISEKLHEMHPEIEIVWGFIGKKKETVPSYVKCVEIKNNFSFYFHLATAIAYVNNYDMLNICKSKKQMFIQTWHGDRAFKKVLYDCIAPGEDNKKFHPESIKGFCNLAIAGSDYGERQYRTAFLYKGEVLKVGTPRNDKLVFVENEKISEIKKKLNLDNDVKILLYAPTLRENAISKEQKIQSIDIERTLDSLEEKYKSKWICFVRAHVVVRGLSGIEDSARIVDVSSYEDMADLLLISDMLITDYSSCAGDYALLKRPLVLFQSDRQEYEGNEREFYFKMGDSPYFIAESQKELEKIISEFDDEKVKKNCEEILEFYGTNETGKASETVAKLIIEHIKKL